jgi:GntR family transcriptional regulator
MTYLSVSKKLHQDLEGLIASKEPGAKLLSEPQLAQQLGVSRATLREAMRIFEIQGKIRRRQGSGTFVTRPSQVIESGLEVLESIQTLADRIGLKVKLGKWRTDIRLPQKREYNTLQIHPNDYVLDVSRVIIAGDRPAAFLTDILPLDVLRPEEVDKSFTGSILDLLLEKGTPKLMVARTDINAVTSSAQVARALGIQRGDALLYLSADLYTPEGRVVNISHSYFLPGYFNFHVVRRIGQQT